MQISIEVSVTDGVSSTARGTLLEHLGAEILEAMQYSVVQQVRLTGMEVDLLAKHLITGETIYVECKAYREPFAADVITKLLGSVTFRDAEAGWLLTTAPLGKDAKGLQAEWEAKPSSAKKKLQIYTPDRLVDLLVRSRRICDPTSLQRPPQFQYANESYLLITNHGRFWAAPVINASAGVPFAVVAFDSITGARITNDVTLRQLSETDTSLRTLKWLGDDTAAAKATLGLSEEAQSIVTVSSGDDWTDYRPARPQDFVGRAKLQQDVLAFLNGVREETIGTRLFAIKSPSGWGKSSAILKLTTQCANIRNRSKFHMYAVDARAALSPRFGSFALLACFRSAISSGFLKGDPDGLRAAPASNPLSDASATPLLSNSRTKTRYSYWFSISLRRYLRRRNSPRFLKASGFCVLQ
jgi:Holliday junction resolvase-like predicted endonuclease